MASPIASTSKRIFCSCQRQSFRSVSGYPSSASPYGVGAPSGSEHLRPAQTPFHQLPPTLRRPGKAVQTIYDQSREKRAQLAQDAARKKQAAREERERYHVLSRPHPIYGYSPGNESLWLDCDLRKCILDREEVWGIKDVPLGDFAVAPSLTDGFELPHALQPAERPASLQFGFAADGEAAEVLFDLLPELNRSSMGAVAGGQAEVTHLNDLEARKRDNMMRLLSLTNASSKDIHKESTRRILEAFVRQPDDTAGAEVQIALLTFKMRRVYAHMQFSPHCRQHIRELPQLYAERQRQLRRLRLSDPERYTTCLARCGIEPRLATAHITWSRTGRRARKRAKEQEWQRRHPGWNKAW